MKKMLLNNIGLKVISVVFAILVWIIVSNVDDSYTTATYSNIKVDIINENQLAEKKKSWTVIEGDKVTVTLKAKRSVLDSINAETDIYAVADLSKLSITNAVQIEVSVLKHASEIKEISLGKVNTLKVYLEDTKTEQFPVTIELEGEVGKGYAIASKSAVPNLVNVTGPQSLVDKIDEVRVHLNVQGESRSKVVQLEPVYYDVNNKELDANRLSCNVDAIQVNLVIYESTVVPVVVNTIGQPAPGYGVAEIIYEPKEITVAGKEEALDKLNSIVINDINVSGKTADFEVTVDAKDYLPKNVVMGQENSEIMIRINIEKMVQRTLTIKNNDIALLEVPVGYNAAIQNLDGEYNISIQGYQKALNKLSVKDLHPRINIGNLSAGQYSKYVLFDLQDNMKLMDRLRVDVILQQIMAAE